MPDWLSSAAKLLGGSTQRSAPEFELTCSCGETLRGVRGKLPQSIPCRRCDQQHFLLPASPYPTPRPRAKRGLNGWLEDSAANSVRTGPAPPFTSAAGTQSAETTPSTQAPRPRQSREPVAAVSNRRPNGPSKTLITPTGSDSPPPHATGPAADSSKPARLVRLEQNRRLRRLFSPVRLVLLVTIAVGLGSGWWLIRLRHKVLAERTLVESTRLAEDELERGDLTAAAAHFDRVLDAIAFLGRSEPRALAIRQQGRETIAAARLCPVSLFEVLREANESRFSIGLTWETLFRDQYHNCWIVVDAPVLRSPQASDRAQYRIDGDVFLGTTQARMTGDLLEFSRLPVSGDVPRRVIFAAQLREFRPDPGADGSWLIVLDPKSGFLWSTPERLDALRFPVDEETAAVLREQTVLLGITP